MSSPTQAIKNSAANHPCKKSIRLIKDKKEKLNKKEQLCA